MKLFFNSQEAMSYELESPSGKDAQLAEMKIAAMQHRSRAKQKLCYRGSCSAGVREAHFCFLQNNISKITKTSHCHKLTHTKLLYDKTITKKQFREENK